MAEKITKKILDVGNKTALLMFSVAFLLVLLASKGTYTAKNGLADKNIVFILLGALLGVAIIIVMTRLKSKNISAFLREKTFRQTVWISTLILCGIRWYLTKATWFITDWDAGLAVETAFSGVDRWATYSFYPNNLFILGIFKFIVNFSRIFTPDFESAYLLIIQIGGVIVCVSCALVAHASNNISRKAGIGYGVFVLEAVFVVLSPHPLIPYTDTYGMLAPALCLYLYSIPMPYGIKISGIISISVLGSAIKPNAIIPCISILIVEALQKGIPTLLSRKIGNAILIIVLSFVGIICVNAVKCEVNSYASQGITIYPELAMSPAHYLMMGWNEETGGGYCQSDVDFSIAIGAYNERVARNLQVFYERIRKMGPSGIMRQIARKTLSNYADGSGGWRMEGTFFVEIKGKNSLLNWFYGIGSYDPCAYTYLAQVLWMFLLIGLVLQWLDKNNASMPCVINITILGQSLFLILFECRSRYFIQFWPYFIVAAVIGWNSLSRRVAESRKMEGNNTHE